MIDVSREQGELTPSLKSRPVISEGHELVWHLFFMASASRRTSMRFHKDSQYIVYDLLDLRVISEALNIQGVNDFSQRLRCVRIMQAMDAAFIKAVNPKVK